MTLRARLRNSMIVEAVLYGILLLFFLQLIADFVEAIYVFGLLGTGIPAEIAAVLLLFSPLLLLLLPDGLSRRAFLVAGGLVLVCRVVEPPLDTRGRMFVAGLGVAAFLVLLPSLVTTRSGRQAEGRGLSLGVGLVLALSLSILFRVLGSGSDVSTFGLTQLLGWLLAAIAGVLLAVVTAAGPAPAPDARRAAARRHASPAPFWRTAGLAVGVMGVLVICYFVFSAPNVVARWTGAAYLPIVAVLVAALSVAVSLLAWRPRLLDALVPGVVIAWNGLFVVALTLTVLAHQVGFPADPGAYPLAGPGVSLLQRVPLYLMLLLAPILPADLMLFARALAAIRPSPRRRAGAFAVASAYLLLMIFAHIFTSTYDYIPVVGPAFRDRFWLVHLVAGLAVALPVFLVDRSAYRIRRVPARLQPGWGLPALVLLLAVAAIAAVPLTAARPGAPPGDVRALKVLTYNIQQGNSADGQRRFDGQLDVIRSADPGVVGLVECDTNRIAGGNADVVRYFADRLDMHSYYGPSPVAGTFGVALLSRYPIENARTVYHHSTREQEATVEAQITAGDRTFNVYVTHLASEDEGENLAQMREILDVVEGRENVILVGDFNFRPDTEQYRMATAVLDDSWLLRWPEGTAVQGIDPDRRIDHIFVSPGTRITASQYLPGPASDHPAMTTTIEW